MLGISGVVQHHFITSHNNEFCTTRRSKSTAINSTMGRTVANWVDNRQIKNGDARWIS
jgi:hypothetical protein